MQEYQGLTKARLKRDQMALGVFPKCHECQKIDCPVLKKPSASLLVVRKPMGFSKFQASGCITPCSLLRLIKHHIILSKLIISQTNCKIT